MLRSKTAMATLREEAEDEGTFADNDYESQGAEQKSLGG